jgi:hypothetical protein
MSGRRRRRGRTYVSYSPPPWAYTPLAMAPQIHSEQVGIATHALVAITSFVSGFFIWTLVRIFKKK